MSEEFFAHYASKYYDPAKAREYYLKNRELKGRPKAKSTSGMSDKQKQGWAYAKNQIATDKKATTKSAAIAQKAKVQKLRTDAAAVQKAFDGKLDQLVAKLENRGTGVGSARRQKIQAEQNRRARGTAQATTRAKKQKAAAELKTALATARDTYAAQKAKNKKQFDNAETTEYNNIKGKVSGPKKKSSRKQSK